MTSDSSLEEVESCPVCGKSSRELEFETGDDDYGSPGRFPLFRCTSCTVVYLGLVPNRLSLKRAYPPDYSEYAKTESARLRLLAKLLTVMNGGRPSYFNAPLEPPRGQSERALDVGTGSGLASLRLSGLGWSVVSLDFEAQGMLLLQRQSIRRVIGDAARPPFAAGSFRFLLANNVLEHVYRPVEALRAWRTVLDPGGRVSICVPNFDAPDRRWFGRNWHGLLSVPRHLVQFTRKSLSLALELGGFREIHVRTAPYPSAGGSILQQSGISYARIKSSRLLSTLTTLATPLDLWAFAAGQGSNLVATGVA